ncbi:aldo/keto reductase [Paucibacter sp. R3-3]|uniref:Aldo/keto reductase n=1 Tax=Roseateles agri TaxID=3098619 RepID=A0ABU5DMW8_9BURK|nr:aldo/keto reductase [Paucibacter sp. R3-3]MDY0747651.1 aldo/keto reductase [Paucibacter sp. R3-3]
MPSRAKQIFKPEFRFGLGGVSLGNEFEKRTDQQAQATLEMAWDMGVRYFDVAPWYGLGLAERRFGHFLHQQPRGDYLLSSKVGKLLKASRKNRHEKMFPFSDSPNDLVIDYSADGVLRSIEDSLQRLGVSYLDVVFVHDLSPDFAWFPTDWKEQYRIARKGAFPALSRLRDEGVIRAWGVGVNTPYAILKVIEDADPDVCLCARQYSLVDHANALNEVMPAVRARQVALVMGSSLNAGFISGSPRYNYGKDNFRIPAEALDKRERLRAVAARHGVDLRAAALQFSAAAPEAVALVVGAGSAEQIQQNWNSMHARIPEGFWKELKRESLIEPNAPTPKTAS